MPEAPLTPQDPGDPANDDGVLPHLIRGPDPIAPWGDPRPGVRFAQGLSRLHGWRRVTARFVAAAVVIAIVLVLLAEFVRNV